MTNLKSKLIRLGNVNPNLRQHLVPILDTLGTKRASDDLDHVGFDEQVRAADDEVQSAFRNSSWWTVELDYQDSDWSKAEWRLYPKDDQLQQATRERGLKNDDLPILHITGLNPGAQGLTMIVEYEKSNIVIFRSKGIPLPPQASPNTVGRGVKGEMRDLLNSLSDWTESFINDWYDDLN